jgi:hypothetical protein
MMRGADEPSKLLEKFLSSHTRSQQRFRAQLRASQSTHVQQAPRALR